MTLSSAKYLFCLLCLLAFVNSGRAQDIPAVSGPTVYQGFSLPAAGEMTYSFTASESARFGYYGSVISSTTGSANLAYLSGSPLNPFRLTYSGGYQYTSGYSGSSRHPEQFFQNLMLSQSVQRRHWSLDMHDTFNFLPDAPVGSLSGIPGLGDVGVNPTGGISGQEGLTNFATRIMNDAGANVSRSLTGRTSMQFGVDYSVLKFTGENTTDAISNNNISGTATITHALSPIRNYFVQYSQSHFTYPDLSVPFSFSTQSLSLGYSASLSRQTKYSVSAGPQRTTTSTVNGNGTDYDVNLQGQIDRTAERSSMSASFSRAVRGGSGITPGARNTYVSAVYNYRLSRVSSLSVDAHYARGGRISALSTSNFSTQTITGSVEAARQIGRFTSAYVSYSLLKQGLTGSANNSAAYNGVSHVIAGGISYTPRAIHLGHQ